MLHQGFGFSGSFSASSICVDAGRKRVVSQQLGVSHSEPLWQTKGPPHCFLVPCCAHVSIVAVKKLLEATIQTAPHIAAPTAIMRKSGVESQKPNQATKQSNKQNTNQTQANKAPKQLPLQLDKRVKPTRAKHLRKLSHVLFQHVAPVFQHGSKSCLSDA